MKKIVLIFVSVMSVALFVNMGTCYAQQNTTMNCSQKAMIFKNQKAAADSTKLALPEYEGGMSELSNYLYENVTYPEALESIQAEGTCTVQFIVGADGAISEAVVVTSSGYPEMDDEAIRVVESFPNWNPASINGQAISMKTQLPIHFKYVPEEN